VGITDYAQGELGDVVFVELPARVVRSGQGESFGTIEAVRRVRSLRSRVGSHHRGERRSGRHPEIVNKDPYGKGWMVKITLSNPADLNALMDSAAYQETVGK